MACEGREQTYIFDCPNLDIKKNDPDTLAGNYHRYLYAMSIVNDMPRDQRGRYLDYGCGSGYGTELIGSMFKDSVGYDPDQTAIMYANEMHHRAGTVFSHQTFTATYNFITLVETIEHMGVQEASHILLMLGKMLAPDGVLFLTTPVARTPDGVNTANPYHIHEYQPTELMDLLRQHFGKVNGEVVPSMGKTYAWCGDPKVKA